MASRRLYRFTAIMVALSLVLHSLPVIAAPLPGVTGKSAMIFSTVTEENQAVIEAHQDLSSKAAAPPIQLAVAQATSTPAPQASTPEVSGDEQGLDRYPPEPPGGPPIIYLPMVSTAEQQEVATASTLFAGAIPLVSGYNLSSIPRQLADVDPAAVLASIAGKYSKVLAYDACDATDPWKSYTPGAPDNDLTALHHTIGFWLVMINAGTLSVAGTEPVSTTLQLCQGWNLIGYPLTQAYPVAGVLHAIAGKYTRVFAWKTTDAADPWKVYDVAVPGWANQVDMMEPGKGYWIYATEATTLTIHPPVAPPTVSFTGLDDGDEVTSPTPVTGTITSTTPVRWAFEHRFAGQTAWTAFATGDTATSGQIIGSFDPTLLLNGIYEVRLTATDRYGQSASSAPVSVVVEGDMKVGIFTISFVDLSIPVAGLSIDIVRTYDSRDKRTGDFGVGWTLSTQDVRVQENGVTGKDWEGKVEYVGGFPTAYCILPTRRHIVSITLPDNSVYKFQAVASPQCQRFVPIEYATVVFEPLPGTQGELAPLDGADVVVWGGPSGPVELLDDADFSPYDANFYQLTLKDGTALNIHQQLGLQTITDLNGNTLTFTPNGVTSTGKSVPFMRDGQGRITSIADPMGNTVQYAYDGNGDLASVIDPARNLTQFTYNKNHDLIDIIDPRGIRATRNVYDESGRLIAMIDPNGKRIELNHDLDARQEVVVDRLGHATIYQYDDQGNVLSKTDALGYTTSYTYDERGNILTATDALSNTTTYTYDAQDNRIAVTNPLGATETFTYNQYGQLLTHIDALGHTWSNAYDAAGRLLAETDPLSRTTTYEYNASGNLTASTTARGGRHEYAYDDSGAVTEYTDPLGAVATFTRNANGQATGYTDPLGRTGSLERRFDGQVELDEFSVGQQTVRYQYDYNENGDLTRLTMPDGNISTVTYDSTGLANTAANTDGHTQMLTYDANYNAASFTNYDGSTNELERDVIDRVTAVTGPDGQRTEWVYNPIGQPSQVKLASGIVISTTYDAVGHIIREQRSGEGPTTYEHNVAGQLIRQIASDGGITRYEWDAAGQVAAVINALGQRTEFRYDADGNLIETRFADGSVVRSTYDLIGRRTQLQNEQGAHVDFTYDEAGQLIAVTDPLGKATNYTYDDMGNVFDATTPTGNRWRFAYNLMGQKIAQTYPWGGTEQYTRSGVGNIIRVTDPTGIATQFDYDPMGRLITRTLASGQQETYTYSPSSLLLSARAASGVANYTYDDKGRVQRIDYADSTFVEFAYDVANRVTSLHAPGGTTTYTYDSEGRLIELTDNQAGDASYTYDLAGRLVQATLPDGSVTTYTRNLRGWVTRIVTVGSDTTSVIRDDTITYDATGNPIKLVEAASGREVIYTFDIAGRVASESRSGPDAGGADYAYDDDWNLVQRGGRTLAYDGTMRLASDGIWMSYTYDVAGRPLSRTNGTVTEHFTYDSLGRLTRMDRSGGLPAQVNLAYNHRGLLVRIEADGVARRLLWNETGAVPRLLEERSENGTLLRRYIYGLGPVAVHDAVDTKMIHSDLLGSVRMLTSVSGSPVSTYAFDAYGEQTVGATDDTSLLRYAGEYYVPELGFYYLRSRFYDPSDGRFLTPDLLDPDPITPQSYNPYLYVGANPVRFTDPLGTFSLSDVSAIVSIISALTSIALTIFEHPIMLIAKKYGWETKFLEHVMPIGLSRQFSASGSKVGLPEFLGMDLSWDTFNGKSSESVHYNDLNVISVGIGVQLQVGKDLDFWGVTFMSGRIFGEEKAPEIPPTMSAEVTFSGTFARQLTVSVKELPKLLPTWSRKAGAIEIQLLDFDTLHGMLEDKGWKWQQFTLYQSMSEDIGIPDPETNNLGLSYKGKKVRSFGISLSITIPVFWWSGFREFDWGLYPYLN